MTELSLFTGAGGGILGSKLLGWKTVGYVEINDYCQRAIAQRIRDKIIDNAPIFGDIKTFISDGYAERYRGLVDVVTGGFPCQPFSVAGRRLGENDSRNMWPETRESICIIRPRFAFLENVPGLLSSGYFGSVLGELSEIGYNARWCVLSASSQGAPHKRDRLWIFAYSKRWRRGERPDKGIRSEGEEPVEQEFINVRSEVSDTSSWRLEGQREITSGIKSELNYACNNSWWLTEPELGRVAHGVADRVDRLRAIGNGQVPICMATAFRILSRGIV